MTPADPPSDRPSFLALVTSTGFEPGFRGGGPVQSVGCVVDTASAEIGITLITSDRDLGAHEPYPGLSGQWVDRARARVFYLPVRRPARWIQLWRELRGRQFDLLYVNSLWSPPFTIVPIVASRLGLIHARMVLLAPRGELSPGSIGVKALKKRTFLRLWGPFLRNMDITWHASTEREAAQIRAACPWARVLVMLNGFTLPEEPMPPVARPEGAPRLVFISRISRTKNLDLALAALVDVRHPVRFDIYGPIEDTEHWARCLRHIERLPAHVQVVYMGGLAHDRVRATFARYDAFLFPTRGENFGHVIAESLSASCPVVCSAETPWTDVLNSGAGAVVSPLTVAGLRAEIDRIATMTIRQRADFRRAAGDAYRAWRSGIDLRNVLDHVRVMPTPDACDAGRPDAVSPSSLAGERGC